MRKRAVYQWGASEYLLSIDVGEKKEYKGEFPWRYLASIACYLSKVVGCRYKFKTYNGVKTIRRWK